MRASRTKKNFSASIERTPLFINCLDAAPALFQRCFTRAVKRLHRPPPGLTHRHIAVMGLDRRTKRSLSTASYADRQRDSVKIIALPVFLPYRVASLLSF